MLLLVLIVALIGVGYILVNLGSSVKTPFTKFAVSMVVVCVVAYLAYPYIASLIAPLMQFSQRL